MTPKLKVCNVSGCPTLTPNPRCPTHEQEADRARGTATERGYTSKGHQAFRVAVIRRDPICVKCNVRPSTVADHWPKSRKDLIDQGLDPNDPKAGRGLCATCHNQETAKHQPGGWAAQ